MFCYQAQKVNTVNKVVSMIRIYIVMGLVLYFTVCHDVNIFKIN